jgi:hypothetical protein
MDLSTFEVERAREAREREVLRALLEEAEEHGDTDAYDN